MPAPGDGGVAQQRGIGEDDDAGRQQPGGLRPPADEGQQGRDQENLEGPAIFEDAVSAGGAQNGGEQVDGGEDYQADEDCRDRAERAREAFHRGQESLDNGRQAEGSLLRPPLGSREGHFDGGIFLGQALS